MRHTTGYRDGKENPDELEEERKVFVVGIPPLTEVIVFTCVRKSLVELEILLNERGPPQKDTSIPPTILSLIAFSTFVLPF